MSRLRSKSARKIRPSTTAPDSIAKAAVPPSAPGLLYRLEGIVALGPSLMLHVEQAERLSEFQNWHTGPSALYLSEARPIMCPTLDASFRPLWTPTGQPLSSRVLLEVASCTYKRFSGGASRPHTVWYFAAWDARGHLAHLSTHPTRKATLALFNQPAERFALSAQGHLIQRPAELSPTGEGVRHA